VTKSELTKTVIPFTVLTLSNSFCFFSRLLILFVAFAVVGAIGVWILYNN